jgi:hypothetical protein
MTLQVCNNPQITDSVLSHKITKLVAVCTRATIACIFQKLKADAASLPVTLSMDRWWGSKQKCRHALMKATQTNNVVKSIIVPMSPQPNVWRPD